MKKSTKRLFAALLAATSLLALTACGGGKTEAPKTDDSKTEQPAEPPAVRNSPFTPHFLKAKSSTISTSLKKRPASRSIMSASPPVRC